MPNNASNNTSSESAKSSSRTHGAGPSKSSGSHAGPRRRRSGPEIPEPTFAERTRTLLHRQRIGYLSSMSRHVEGFPFGSLMPYALDASGRPLFLISKMAMHTQNVDQNASSSLLVPEQERTGSPLGAARATLVGETRAVPGDEREDARARYLERHENAHYWVDYDDFGFYRLEPVNVYYVGGFGVMGWVEADDYAAASPDPLADHAAGIVDHMNEDHVDAMILLAAKHLGLEAVDASMTAVDRLGFHLRLDLGGQYQGARIAFSRPVETPADTRAVLVEMVRAARGE